MKSARHKPSPVRKPWFCWLDVAVKAARYLEALGAYFTDSHYLREAFGTVAYGFFPIKAMDAEQATKLVHSANERIAVDDLELGVEMLRSTARSLLS